jgi:hypothetical protein
MKNTRRFATCLLIFLSLVGPSLARANTYTVEGCGATGSGALQFSSDPPSGFQVTDSGCSASSNPTFASISYQSSNTYVQGDQASWGVEAPAGEVITGLGVKGGLYIDSLGWLSGWTLNGNIDENALPSEDDCLSYSSSECNVSGGTWFPIASANSVQLVMYCDAVAVPSGSCSTQSYFSNSVAAFNNAVVEVQDPGNASPEESGSLWSLGQGLGLSGGWISGVKAGANLSMSFQASDPGGICTLEAVLTDAGGNLAASSGAVAQSPTVDAGSAAALADNLPPPFVSTQPCGGPSTGVKTFAPDLALLPTGTYYLNVASQNPGEYQVGSYTYATGNELGSGAAIKIDNAIPSVAVTASNSNSTNGRSGESWSAAPESLTVDATVAAGSSGLAQMTCTTPDGTASYPVSGDRASVVVKVSTPGSDSVSCDATSVAGNASTVASTDFEVDAQAPTLIFSGAGSAPAWDSGNQTITVTGSEATQASGIAGLSCQLDGGAWISTPGSVAHLRVSGDGKHDVSCYATTIAGVEGLTTSEAIQIDSKAPTLAFSAGPNEAAWHRTGQTITATADAADGDQISAIKCTLEGSALSHPNGTTTSTESVVIPVAAPGGDLDCEAQDSAGNVSSTESWSFLIDDRPPTGYFMAANAVDPAQVEVSLADSGSGVAGASIQIYVDGAWRSLPTRFDAADRIASARVPDDGSLKNGTYGLRARAWDKAGNRDYVTRNKTGTAESVALPMRELTDLTAVLSAGRARVSVTASTARRHLYVRYGQRVHVAGQLAADGGPVVHAMIVISERLGDSSAIRTIAKTATNGGGESHAAGHIRGQPIASLGQRRDGRARRRPGQPGRPRGGCRRQACDGARPGSRWTCATGGTAGSALVLSRRRSWRLGAI